MAVTTAQLETLYRERYARFRDVLAGIVGSHDLAREVVQEAFARALRDRKKFRGEGSLESWVWRIALNQAFRARRDLKLSWNEETERPVEDRRADSDVRAAVRSLPPRRRLMVFLRYFADLSYEEIASVCGVSEGTVAATLAQAREELVGCLTPEGAGDVLRRSRRAVRRRRGGGAVAALAVAVAGVASAYALGHPVVDFGKAQRGSLKQVNEFGSMQVGAPRGMAPGVLPHETRRITAVRIDGKVHVLYVAPTKAGGFCSLWSNLGGGCRANRHERFAAKLDAGGLVGRHGLVVLQGSFFQAAGDRLTMSFKDGTTADVPFTWVTAPIDAGFYLYRVPDAHRRAATRPVALALFDKDGKLLDREPIMTGEPLPLKVEHVRGFPPLRVQNAGVWAQRRQLFDLRAPNGARFGLWAMPKRGGGRCFVTNTASGCTSASPHPVRLPVIQLGLNGDRLCCTVSTKIARLEARFQDGALISLYPREGYLVWPIPAGHYAPGHRIVALIGYDGSGRAIARAKLPAPADQRGIYPCKHPHSLGYGVEECA